MSNHNIAGNAKKLRALFIVTGSDKGTWLSEVTHPYWHLAERGVIIDIATPLGNEIVWDPFSDPSTTGSAEADDLVSKGFMSDPALAAKLKTTLKLTEIDLELYDAVHIAGGLGATYDLFPSDLIAGILEHFWKNNKAIGALCHGVIALANNPERIKGLHLTGYTTIEDEIFERGSHGTVTIPHYPQRVLENAGANFSGVKPLGVCVVKDGKLVTGQNQFSASEYALILYHIMTGHTPVSDWGDIKMLKLDILIRRRPETSHEDFSKHWENFHATFFANQPAVKKYIKRYTQSRTIAEYPESFGPKDFDGVAQLWFDDIDGLKAFYASEDYNNLIRADEITFVDPKNIEFILSEETPIMV